MPNPATESRLTRASALETAGVMVDVAIPLLARGVIVSRPRVVDMLDRFDFRLRFSIG